MHISPDLLVFCITAIVLILTPARAAYMLLSEHRNLWEQRP
jgi:hypothetical protein